MPALLDMTDVPMTHILEQCDFKSVMTLRKVCHSLRNFINEANFKTNLGILRITINSTDCSFRSYNYGSAGAAEHCPIDDMKSILRIQNSEFFVFAIENPGDNSGALDAVEKILSNKPRPLQTNQLEIRVLKGSDVLKILPYSDAKVLKNITIFKPRNVREVSDFEGIERVLELDQFKNASDLCIHEFSLRADLKKFFHFESISVTFQEIPMEDLVALKEAFTTSTHMRWFTLEEYNMDREQFEGVFGTPLKYNQRSEAGHIVFKVRAWYFKIRNCNDHVLEIYRCKGEEKLTFRRVEIADVQENAIVRD